MIRLPLHTDSEPSSLEENEPPRGRGTVLVVDDEDVVRKGAQMMLDRQGFQTIAASSGAQALEILHDQQEQIDAVVLDMSMPGNVGARGASRSEASLAKIASRRVHGLLGRQYADTRWSPMPSFQSPTRFANWSAHWSRSTKA